MSRKKYVIELEDGIYWLMCGNPSTIIALNLSSDKPAEGYIFNETGLGAMTTLEEYEKRETNMTYNEFYRSVTKDYYEKKREEDKMISGIDRVSLSAPWYTLLHEYEALFKEDKGVDIVWDDDERRLDIRVHDLVKANALAHLLPHKYIFGDDVLTVRVIPPKTTRSKIDLFCEAFKGNPVVSRVVTKLDATSMFDRDYVVFRNKIVQFFNDDLTDINGNLSTLYEDIARDIFKDSADGIYFCTEGELK